MQTKNTSPSMFSVDDIGNVASLAKKLADKTTPVSNYLRERWGNALNAALQQYFPTKANPQQLQEVVVDCLNKTIAGPSLFGIDAFKDVKLRDETVALHKKNPQGVELQKLNRLLLEDAYPELSRNQISLDDLRKASQLNYSTLQHWSRTGLLDFERNGRLRIYPKEENLKRITFILSRQRRKSVPWVEIKKQIEAGAHRKPAKIGLPDREAVAAPA